MTKNSQYVGIFVLAMIGCAHEPVSSKHDYDPNGKRAAIAVIHSSDPIGVFEEVAEVLSKKRIPCQIEGSIVHTVTVPFERRGDARQELKRNMKMNWVDVIVIYED